MKTLTEWRIKESTLDQLKSNNFSVDPDIKTFISPRIGKIQEAIVLKLSQDHPNIKSFRDVPPQLRNIYAQAIIAETIELFFKV